MNDKSLPLEYGMVLDVDSNESRRPVCLAHFGDFSAKTLNITLSSGGEKIVLPENSAVTLFAQFPDGSTLWSPCTVLSDGTVSHTFTSSEMRIPGDMFCELYIVTPDSEMTTPKFRVTVEKIIRDNSAIEATDDYSVLGDMILRAQNMNVSLAGKTISVTDKNGAQSTVSFSEKTDGKVTVTFTDETSAVSSFDICDGESAGIMGADEFGVYTCLGTNIYLLDEDEPDNLSVTCSKIYNDEKDYFIFVRYCGKCYPAQYIIARNKLRITYTFNDADDANMLKRRTIIWSGSGKDNKISFENAYLYARYENRYDEEYYSTCPPTVMTVEKMLSEKYTLPEGGIPETDISGDLEEWVFTLEDGSTVTKKVKVFA